MYKLSPVTGRTGVLAKLELPSAAVTDPLPSKQFVQVAGKADSGSKFGALKVGDLYYNTTASPITVTTGDSYYLIGTPGTSTAIKYACFLTSFSFEFSSTEQDFTTLCDNQTVNIPGTPDVSGTFEGYLTYPSGSTLALPDTRMDPDDLTARFLEVITIDSTAAIDIREIETTPLAFLGFTVDNQGVKGVKGNYMELLYAPALNVSSINVGVSQGEENATFTSNVSLGPDALNRGIKKYRITTA